MNGLLASNISQIVVHVHIDEIVAGFISGTVVLVGVVLTELLVRHRERRRRLEEAAWDLQNSIHGDLLTGDVERRSGPELGEAYSMCVRYLGRIRTDARWPIQNAKQIQTEVDDITIRLAVALGKMGTHQAGSPRLGPILGDRLLLLIFPGEDLKRGRLNDALRAEGLPTLDEVTADQRHNVPLPNAES